HFHRIGENVDAAQHLVARIDGESDFLGSHRNSLLVRHPEERAKLASKGAVSEVILRGPLRGHLRMTGFFVTRPS
ncbi:MAG: hypothetical protein WA893_21990, partial [Xanthobacteraceae bacterium]